MFRSTKTFLIIGVCMVASLPALAAGSKYLRTVPRIPTKTVIISPPRTSAYVELKPYGPSVKFVNKWYCDVFMGIEINARTVDEIFRDVKNGFMDRAEAVEILSRLVGMFLDRKKADAVKFFGRHQAAPWKANPAQGQTLSKTWEHCYSKPELEAYKREAIRWARYIKNVYVPSQKRNTRPTGSK